MLASLEYFYPIILAVAVGFAGLLVLKSVFAKRFGFDQSHVVITGGSQGLGLAMATQASARGARVTIMARKQQQLDSAKQAIELEHNCSVKVFSVDMTDSEAVAAAMKKAEEAHGPIDVLICNAGMALPGVFLDNPVEEVKKMMDVNFLGTVNAIHAALKGMKERKRGRIACISSVAGQIGLYGLAGYSASKFALRGFCDALQMEVAPSNIVLSLAFPPDMDTPGFAVEKARTPEITGILCEGGGLWSPQQVAKAVLDGIDVGRYHIWFGLEGFMTTQVTAGCSPTHHILDGVLQVATASLFRAVAIIVNTYFNYMVKSKTK